MWPVVEPRFGLEHPETDDVLATVGFGCKFPAQLIEEPTVFDIRPTVYPIYGSVLILPTVVVAAALQQLLAGNRSFFWLVFESALPYLVNQDRQRTSLNSSH